MNGKKTNNWQEKALLILEQNKDHLVVDDGCELGDADGMASANVLQHRCKYPHADDGGTNSENDRSNKRPEDTEDNLQVVLCGNDS